MNKVNIYLITHIRFKIFLCLIIISFIFIILCNNLDSDILEVTQVINTKNSISFNILGKDFSKNISLLKEYENMPRQINNYKIIGEIIIPKLNIHKYILEETNKQSLKKSVTKICGPQINEIGNFCIAGHNYNNIFGKIHLLEIGDEIILKDTYDRILKYKVYKKEIISQYDTNCLLQNTSNKKEITLVTCTIGAIKRLVIKASESYT